MSDGSFESTGPRPAVVPEMQESVPAKSGGGCAKILIIGCISVVVLAVIAVILIVVFWSSIIDMTVPATFEVAKEVVQESELPESDKERIVSRLDAVFAEFEAGNIQGTTLYAGLLQCAGMMAPGLLHFALAQQIDMSDLPEEEKAEGRLTVERVTRGAFQGDIDVQRIGELFQELKGDDKQKMSSEDLRDILTKLKTLADDHDIANEGYEVNYADEFISAFDRAMEIAKSK